MRTELGAPRNRLIRQLLTKRARCSPGGAIAGLSRTIVSDSLNARARARRNRSRRSGKPFGCQGERFALGLRAVTGILFGLRPAVQVAGVAYFPKSRRARHYRRGEALRSLRVVSETTLPLVLLTGAGLLLKSFLRMRAVDSGLRAENVLTMTVDLPIAAYSTFPSSLTRRGTSRRSQWGESDTARVWRANHLATRRYPRTAHSLGRGAIPRNALWKRYPTCLAFRRQALSTAFPPVTL